MDAQIKNEIIELTKAMLETFTKEYIKAYTIQLTKKAIKDAKAIPSPYLLDPRPRDHDKSDIFSGYLVKLGAIRKNWLKRHFVVRYDYSIDYFVDDTHANKKGTINLCGYSVNDDPNKSGLDRILKIAEKMGVDTNSVPKPAQLPPFTIELYHYSRRCYYIQCSNEEEFKEWIEIFKTCCRRSYGFKNKDPCHIAAFGIAVRNTRWSLGRWGWFGYGGNENQILSDIILDEIEYDILGRALSKLPNAPWFIRNYLRNKMMTVIEGMVSSAVAPAWAGLDKTVGELRPTIEPRIKNQVDPIAQAQNSIVNKMRESMMSQIKPAMEEHVNKHLKKIIGEIRTPIENGFDESLKIWNEKTNAYNGNGSTESFSSYRSYPSSYWTMYPAKDKISPLYNIIDQYRPIFKDYSSYYVCYDIKEAINNMAYDGSYTLEKTVTQDQVDVASAKNQTHSKYQHDVILGTNMQMKFVVREMVKPTLCKIINPLTKPLLSSLSSAIPSAIGDFIDINELYNQLIDDILGDSTQVVIDELN
ncbi:hypothetical protein ACTA71_011596 [Dictyostelium dimigraforme]